MSACPITGYPAPIARTLLGGLDRPFDLWDQTDDSLVRLRRHHLRRASDLVTDQGDEKQARRERYMAREVHDHQLMRFRLRMRYGAVDDHIGTTSYDCYIRHDEAPAYALALYMDASRARLGMRHVFDWPTAVAA